jgi:hypothetical protein
MIAMSAMVFIRIGICVRSNIDRAIGDGDIEESHAGHGYDC